MDTSTTCEFCKDKKGLAVLPVRYTVAPVSAGAPKVAAPMAVTDVSADPAKPGQPLPLQSGSAAYTTRLIRAGYLYVYDEARDRWEGYYVTSEAYFLPFDITKPLPANLIDKRPCNGSGHAQVVSMIAIRAPKQATTVWFGYSETQWTPAVLARHRQVDYRQRHMQALDVKALLSGKAQPHTHPIGKLGSVVSEFHLHPDKRKSEDFVSQNPFPYHLKTSLIGQTLAEAEWMGKGTGVILAVNDPVGVAVELATMMSVELARHTKALEASDKKYHQLQRKVAVAGAIAQLRVAVHNQAEIDCIANAPAVGAMTAAVAGVGTLFDPQLRNGVEQAGKVDAAKLDAAGKNAWRRYTHRQSGRERFKEQDVAAFYQDYEQQYNKIIREHIDPLGRSHIAWMTSGRMTHYYSCNFDSTDMRSGAAYLGSVTQCVHGTEGVRPCFTQYETWLDAQTFKPENIVLRALVFNNDELVKKLQEATALDPRVIPWDNLQAVFNAAMEQLNERKSQHAEQVAGLLARLTGPMTKPMTAVIDGAMRPVAILLGAVIGGWRPVALSGKRGEFRAQLTRLILQSSESSTQKLTKAQIEQAVKTELKRAEIRGEKLSPQHTTRWLAYVDQSAAKEGKAVLASPKTYADIQLHKFRDAVGLPLLSSFAVCLLQYYCVTKAVADYGRSLAADQTEALWRLRAAQMGMAGGLMETAGKIINKSSELKMPWAQGVRVNAVGKFLSRWGMRLSFSGAIIMAGWDIFKMKEELGKDNYLTGGLYFVSAVLGVAGSLMLALCATNPFTLLVVTAFLAVAYFLETTKDNPLQSWLENCIFGVINSYTTGEMEMEEYNKAIA